MIKSIQITTDEEVNKILTQAKLDAQQQKHNIITLDQQKQEQLFLEQQKMIQQNYVIDQSKQLDEARKKILNQKIKIINDVIEKSKKGLLQLPEEQYKQLLVKLVKQCVEMINNKNIIVILCETDQKYKDYIVQQLPDIKIKFSENYLRKEDVIGGVIVQLENGEVKIDNTLQQRLNIFKEQNIDKIESKLFKEHDSSLWEN